ncbi:sarcosine oxidase [Enterocytozoon bieneusi H348]|jgi:sarcosine oxidase|uniref:Sarcosine oxidase n=1 Tax=Pseudomonas poae TaxID=200451 RepID=A0A7Z1GXD0_9PSED|nr:MULTISPECIES: N-methyl-L-tryptophan oxidase [Pseudomonas fluorescens group]EED43392.1 sarcosine oxidase [Enterocytozoon bieneusi H348]NMZ90704.1 N-methyl-L-tryptophan oxidase [Pseudomonas marginalis]PFG71978.1 sarcosine oxidase [Pseudomonas poae]|eukprot:XP_002650664.1 sarcosine oxidase [Enterocytozoon bieneusi H348]
MNRSYDVIVIGLGIMGAAALWRVASKCTRSLGIDASGPSHCHGSSHGASRIFRRAYWEGEKYLQLLNHADLLWKELEQVTQRHLLFRTGGVFIGDKSSRIVSGSIETAKKGKIEHEVWIASDARKHLPAFNIQDEMAVVYEPGAYAISASEARLAMLNDAVLNGAFTEFGNNVVKLEKHGTGVRVTTKSGCIYFAGSVIVTTGPWITTNLMPELTRFLEPRRVPIYWFKPKAGCETPFSQEQFPIFLYERQDGGLLYGVPSIVSNEPDVKIGFHNRQQSPSLPGWENVPVQHRYITEIPPIIESIFPKLEGIPTQAKNCFYTMSRDESFLIGHSKALESTYFASACSGHGFKFAPAIGDALANMAIGQQASFSLSAFSVDRFN